MISGIKLFLAYLNGFSNEGNKVFVFTELCYQRTIPSEHFEPTPYLGNLKNIGYLKTISYLSCIQVHIYNW